MCLYPLNLQVSAVILKYLPKPLQLPEWTFLLTVHTFSAHAANPDITQQRNDKSLITNTESIFLRLLHTTGMTVRKAHHAQRSFHAGALSLSRAAFLPALWTACFHFFDHLISCVSSSFSCPQQFLQVILKFSFPSAHCTWIRRPGHLLLNGV